MIHPEDKHTDPHRLPHIQQPIENAMINIHTVGVREMLVDVTKLLVTQAKKK